MKQSAYLISLVVLILAACTPETVPTPPTASAPSSVPANTSVPASTNIPLPTEAPSSVHAPAESNPAELAAVQALSATLHLTADQIRIVSSQAVIWPNGCMGVQRIGMMCTQQEVPGYVIFLAANGKQYEFHTNRDGSQIAPAGGMQVSGPVTDAAIKQLASNLGISAAEVKLVSASEVEWPDSCLGIAQEGVMCAQMITSGYLIVLEAQGRNFEYHTSSDGSRIVPGTLVVDWKRDGGIAGFCDELAIYASGEVYGYSCKTASDGRMGVLKNLVSSSDLQKFYGWLEKYGTAQVDLSDPKGAADAMTRKMSLNGDGSGQPAQDEMQMLYTWVQDLYQQLYK